MAVDVSTLTLKVKSEGISNSKKSLDDLATSAKKTEEAFKNLTTAMEKAGKESSKKSATNSVLTASTRSVTATQVAQAEALRIKYIEQRRDIELHNAQTRAYNQSRLEAIRMNREIANSTTAMREAHAMARGLSGSLGMLWLTYGNIAGMTVGVALAASLKAVFLVGKDVEHTLEGIRVRGNETVEAVDAIRESVLNLGKGIYGPQEVAKAFETLILAGKTAKEALSGISDALNLATVGGTSIEKSAFTIVQVGTALGYAATNYNRIADVIAATAAASMSSVESLSEAFKSGSAVGKLYGVTLEDIGVSFAALSNLGIKGSAAGTSLKNFYKELSSEEEKVKKTLKSMQLVPEDFKNADGKYKSLIEVVEVLSNGLSKLNGTTRQLAIANLSNERGMKTAVELLDLYEKKAGGSANALVELRKKIEDSYGFASVGAAQMALTVDSQFKAVSNTLKTTFAESFKSLTPQLTIIASSLKAAFGGNDFKEAITSIANAVADLTVALVDNAKVLAVVLASFLAFKAISVVTGLLVSMGSAMLAFSTAATGARLSALAFQASLGLIGIALAAAGTALVWYSSKKEEVSAKTREAIQYSGDYASALEVEAKRLNEQLVLMKEGKNARDAETEAIHRQTMALADQKNFAMRLEAETRSENAIANVTPEQLKISADIVKRGGMMTGAVKEYHAAQENLIRVNRLVDESHARNVRAYNAVREASKALEVERKKQEEENKKVITGTGTFGEKEDSAAINAAYQRAITKISEDLDKAKREFSNFQSSIQSQLRTGVMTELQSVDLLTKAHQDMYAKEIVAYNKMLAITSPKNSTKPEEIARSKRAAEDKLDEEVNRLRDARAVATAKLEQENLDNYLKTLEARGRYEEAAYVRGDKLFSSKIKAEQAYLATLKAGLQLAPDQSEISRINSEISTLETHISGMVEQVKAITQEGRFKDLSKNFELLNAETTSFLKSAKVASESGGLSAMWDAAIEAQDRYMKQLPLLKAAQDAVNNAANTPAQKTVAEQQLAAIAKQSEAYRELFNGVGNSIGKSLEAAFGKGGKALGSLVKLTLDYNKTDTQSTSQRIKYYGDMAGAAAEFFDEQSKGYKILSGISQAFHAYELAQLVITNTQKAVAAVLNQAGGDPYTAFGRMAAMAAAVAGLGYAVSGGFNTSNGNAKSAAEVQKAQGTGSVFGDVSAKSQSISNSIDMMKQNSSLMLPLTSAMLRSLQNIESSMVGLTNLVIRTTGLKDGTNLGIETGTLSRGSTGAIGSVINFATKALSSIPLIGGLLGGIADKISSLWGSTKQSIIDSGIMFKGAVADLQKGGGYNQYATVQTTSSSWFGLKKSTSTSVQTQQLNEELSQQFGLIFSNLESSLKVAAKALGSDELSVAKAIDNLVIDTQVSLNGLSGADITAALNGVVSKTMDQISEAAFPQMGAFRQVGEGYAQTVLRVATGIEQASVALKEFGISAIKYSEIGNKSGDVSAQIISQSIAIKEGASGVGEIMKNLTGGAEDLINTYRELTIVRKQLTDSKLGGGLNIATIEGAGGLDKLKTAVTEYYDKYFTLAEKTATETKNLTEQFYEMGKELPKSREQLRSWIEAAASAGDQNQVGKLLSLASAFDKVAEATGQASSAEDLLAVRRKLEYDLITAQGDASLILIRDRKAEMDALGKLTPDLIELKLRIWELNDATAFKLAKDTLQVKLLTAQNRLTEASAITRANELAAIRKVNPELEDMQKTLYKVEDAANAFKLKMDAVSVAMNILGKSVQKQKDAENKLYQDAKDAETKAYDSAKDALKIKQEEEKKSSENKHKATLDNIEKETKAQKESAKIRTEALKEANAKEIEAVKSRVDSAKKLLDSLKASLDATTAYDAMSAHSAAISTVMAAARSSNSSGYIGIDEAIKELAKNNEDMFSSSFDYQRSQAQANEALNGLRSAGETQLTEAQKQLTLLESLKESIDKEGQATQDAIEAASNAAKDAENARYDAEQAAMELRHAAEETRLKELHDANMAIIEKTHDDNILALDNILVQAQLQVDKLNDINTSVMTLAQAQSNFSVAVLAATAKKGVLDEVKAANPTVTTDKNALFVENLYGSLLGRHSEAGGLKFWTEKLSTGALNKAEVIDGFLKSVEYKSVHPSFDVGINEVPRDMLANIHKGERIMPAADNAELMRRLKTKETSDAASKSDEDFKAKVSELVEAIKIGDVANVQKTNEIVRILRDWDGNGMPKEREE